MLTFPVAVSRAVARGRGFVLRATGRRRALAAALAWVAFGLASVQPASGGSVATAPLSDPVRHADDYYLGRRNTENVYRALDLLRAGVASHPGDYEAWWRIAKFTFYLAGRSSQPEKVKLLAEGVQAGRRAVALAPNRVEGHFWLGANYSLTAESRHFLRGLSLLDVIRREMETVVRLDSEYEQGAGLQTLARVYYRAPFFKGGDKRRSMELLEDCLTRYPENSLTMLYLADSYLALGLRAEAREQLERILALCPDPQYGPELAAHQDEARARLARHFRAQH